MNAVFGKVIPLGFVLLLLLFSTGLTASIKESQGHTYMSPSLRSPGTAGDTDLKTEPLTGKKVEE